MPSFQNIPGEGTAKNFLFPCITCYLLLVQMQGNTIASFRKIIKSLLTSDKMSSLRSEPSFISFIYFILFLFFGNYWEYCQSATHFLCFFLNSIHTGSNFWFAVAFLSCSLLSVPQNQCRVSCDWQGFFPSVCPGHLPKSSLHVESMQSGKWLLWNPFKKLHYLTMKKKALHSISREK